jgi:hypothetical protein
MPNFSEQTPKIAKDNPTGSGTEQEEALDMCLTSLSGLL